jgi:hypothetical protein
LGNGNGTFQAPQHFTSPIRTVHRHRRKRWYYVGLNNHKGGFTQVPQTFGADSTGAVLVDLNGDGDLDLVCTDNVYLGDGKGDFTFLTAAGFGNAGGGTFD